MEDSRMEQIKARLSEEIEPTSARGGLESWHDHGCGYYAMGAQALDDACDCMRSDIEWLVEMIELLAYVSLEA